MEGRMPLLSIRDMGHLLPVPIIMLLPNPSEQLLNICK
jgi:hypothetical protein